MKALIKTGLCIVIACLIYNLAESYTLILLEVDQGQLTNIVYLTASSSLKAFAFALSTIMVILLYTNLFIKLPFLLLDGAVMILRYHTDKGSWINYSGYVLACGMMLSFFFLGKKFYEYYQDKIKVKPDNTVLKLRRYEIAEEILKLKKRNSGNIRWDENPDILSKIETLESERNKIDLTLATAMV